MFKRVDFVHTELVGGFSYLNKTGREEYVEMDYRGGTGEYVKIMVVSDSVMVYRQDVPKLILALQAAYDFKGN